LYTPEVIITRDEGQIRRTLSRLATLDRYPLAVVFLEVPQDWGPALTALRGCGSVLLKFELRQTAPDPFVPPTRSPGRDTIVRCIFHCVLKVVTQTTIFALGALRLRERTKGISGDPMLQNPWCSGAALLIRGVEALAGPT
jgi:hypothetical protein